MSLLTHTSNTRAQHSNMHLPGQPPTSRRRRNLHGACRCGSCCWKGNSGCAPRLSVRFVAKGGVVYHQKGDFILSVNNTPLHAIVATTESNARFRLRFSAGPAWWVLCSGRTKLFGSFFVGSNPTSPTCAIRSIFLLGHAYEFFSYHPFKVYFVWHVHS